MEGARTAPARRQYSKIPRWAKEDRQVKSGAIKLPDGRSVSYDVKLSYDKLYYSFDGGVTWARKKKDAFDSAERAGLLAVKDERGIFVRTVDD
jgi:hypothetical protein